MVRCMLSMTLMGVALGAGLGRSALQVEVTKEVRCQEKAKTGDKVTVHYGGFLQDGKKFDSSFDRAQPFTFTIGVGQVIPGWDQGLIGVCKGEERHLVVPSPLAYGDRGAGDVIPPGATLLFDIVIVDVEKEFSNDQKNMQEKKRKEEEARKREEEENIRKRVEKEEELRKKEKEEKAREEEVRRIQEVERAREKEMRRKAEEERVRKEELAREKALKQELARKAQEEKRRKAEQRKSQEQKRRREEQRKREEQKKQKEEEEQRRKQQQEDEIRRRQKESDNYEYDEYEYDYDYESACEPGELKMQVTSSPARCSKISRIGNQLTMHYTGKLISGKKFDSSVDRNKPFQFTLGVGQVIAGWDQGLVGMCVGEKRTLIIPPDMAYGEQGVGAVIPPCSVLVFEVELLDIAN